MNEVTRDNVRSFLGQKVLVVMDQPVGSQYSGHGETITYPVNYGYVPETCAPDGDEQDVYVLGVSEPLQKFVGVCIAIIHRKDDNEDKLVVVPEGVSFTKEEILAQTHFQERFFKVEVWE